MNLTSISGQSFIAGVLLVLLTVLPYIPSAPADPIAELLHSLNSSLNDGQHDQREIVDTTLSIEEKEALEIDRKNAVFFSWLMFIIVVIGTCLQPALCSFGI
ncbi:unnamed protein product [Bursaphelenchus okinawaensis]|uniref:TMhelix containing protein n=1 Tax=Bursaphelenchus okinawaensis TaxID=465554 RepID=A0A811JW61_9BILA|nr:unnamed protein product [Bursaphelenchus okinawaensis]CAG9086458.1 unnamed protein product [Bursaphelenchus okinawaensis]